MRNGMEGGGKTNFHPTPLPVWLIYTGGHPVWLIYPGGLPVPGYKVGHPLRL